MMYHSCAIQACRVRRCYVHYFVDGVVDGTYFVDGVVAGIDGVLVPESCIRDQTGIILFYTIRKSGEKKKRE